MGTTFSQNNGVIKLTACASRSAGFSCAFWLILFGVWGKLGAAFNSIPICVVGGLVIQCFSGVFVSGMIIAMGVAMQPNLFEGGGVGSYYSKNLRNNVGFWPHYLTCDKFPTDGDGNEVNTCTNSNGNCCVSYDDDADSNRTTLIILLKTPYAIGTVIALFLHLLLPEDVAEGEKEGDEKSMFSA